MSALRAALGGAVLLVLCGGAAIGQDTSSYWVSMRSMVGDPTPMFISASATQNGQQDVAIQGCDGNVYYLVNADAVTLQAALQNDDVVQMNVTPQGQQPDGTAAVICVIQSVP